MTWLFVRRSQLEQLAARVKLLEVQSDTLRTALGEHTGTLKLEHSMLVRALEDLVSAGDEAELRAKVAAMREAFLMQGGSYASVPHLRPPPPPPSVPGFGAVTLCPCGHPKDAHVPTDQKTEVCPYCDCEVPA